MLNRFVNVRPRGTVISWKSARRLLAAAAPLLLAAQLFAQGTYLTSGRPDGVVLLAPPPATNSAEAVADLATVRSVFKARTPEETARAGRHDDLSLYAFSVAIGPSFTRGKFPKTEELYQRVRKEIGDPINVAKDHWKRKRPYELDETLAFGKPEKSASYPSGHSTRGTVYAMVLAEVFPEKREEILAIGREIGWDRVLIGKHFPTDIYAGRVLAKAIFRELMASEAFQHDLAEAKEEAQAAQHPVLQGR